MISGLCEPQFSELRVELERNFAERGELGAAVCVTVDGRTVVDLWGGVRDPATGAAWEQDTMVVVFSCTKGAVALCVHMLADRGLLDLDAPVADYWPEFAQHGKEGITVRMVLNHQAGLPGLQRALAPEEVHDDRAAERLLEAERPLWEPGTRHGYHALTFGWLAGGVVRRVTGRSVGTFFAEEVAGPLGLDFHIGLPANQDHRVAVTVMPEPQEDAVSDFVAAALAGGAMQQAAVSSFGEFLSPGGCDAPGAHQAEIPAAGAITNARGLAGLYAPLSLGGALGDVRLVGPRQMVAMATVESAALRDAVMLEPGRFTAGFEKATSGLTSLSGVPGALLFSDEAFGHSGFGGSIGFADPGGRFSFGYTLNRHVEHVPGGVDRYQRLIDATYRALGYGGRETGRWRPGAAA